MDRSVAPGDDFFAWANGSWMKATEIPADRSSWGSGGEMTERTAKRTAELIAEAAKSNAPAGSEARKIGDTYSTFLDEAAIEAKGLAPLKPSGSQRSPTRVSSPAPSGRRSAPTSTS